MSQDNPRIAILGFAIECNRFSPVTTAADFEQILALRPEVVLLGTGARQRFAHPRLYASLSAARIGLEMMDTGAACRTYNILMAEGRKVLAALIPPTP